MAFTLAFLLFFVNFAFAAEPNDTVLVFHGTSDASAAVAIGSDKFIVADDENNILRIYKIGVEKPLISFDLTKFLAVTAKNPEADIEGATKVGNRAYWITSHGRNKDGESRPNRYRFFAAEIAADGNNISINPVGKPYKDLTSDLVGTKSAVQKDFIKATGFNLKLKGKDLEKLAPKNEGLNIEALCADPNGQIFYIGLRNPLHKAAGEKKYAIVLPLLNPASVVENNQKCIFGNPLLWDLAGRGVRSMEWSPAALKYFIIAGPSDERRDFALYSWTGRKDKQPQLIRKLILPENFTPEALIVFDKNQFLVLSDDGTIEVKVASPADCIEGQLLDGSRCPNKFLTDPNKKTFRALWLKISDL